MKRCLVLLILSWIMPSSLAAEPIRLCQDEIEETPWRTLSNDGLNTLMLRMVASQLNLDIRIESLSWKRCLTMVQHGEFDGAIAASFRQERLQIGTYPATAAGLVPDRNRRLSGEAYYFYKRKESAFEWDGQTLLGAQLPVAAQMGYSTVSRLQEKGVRVDDRERKPEHLFRKVLLGLDSAAVLAQGEGDRLLNDPRFAGKIVKLPIPFYQTDGYLLFSHAFVARDSQLAERIWDSISTVRRSSAYHKTLAQHGIAPQD